MQIIAFSLTFCSPQNKINPEGKDDQSRLQTFFSQPQYDFSMTCGVLFSCSRVSKDDIRPAIVLPRTTTLASVRSCSYSRLDILQRLLRTGRRPSSQAQVSELITCSIFLSIGTSYIDQRETVHHDILHTHLLRPMSITVKLWGSKPRHAR